MTVTFVGSDIEVGTRIWHFRVAHDDGISEPLHLKDAEHAGWDQAEATTLAEAMAAELAADRELLGLVGVEM